MILFRPVGRKEIDLIMNTGNRRFPERLPAQPIFYPVLNKEYAFQIARDWNTKDEKSEYCGFVLEFEVNDEYISKFEIHKVGSSLHKELWVPAEELEEFNQNIKRNILLIKAFYGEEYKGKALIKTPLQSKNYDEQLLYLCALKNTNTMDFICEVLVQWKIISQNYFLWKERGFSSLGIKDDEKESLLNSMKTILIENVKWFMKE